MKNLTVKRILAGGFGLIAFYGLLLEYPEPLFSHSIKFQNLIVYSDREIPQEAAEDVLTRAKEKISRSPFFRPDRVYRIFLCNSPLSRIIYLRSARGAGGRHIGFFPMTVIGPGDFAKNRLIRSNGEPFPETRPMDYFIAHEITHQMTREYLGIWAHLGEPEWLIEGYADYIGKGRLFSFFSQLDVLKKGLSRPEIWKFQYDRYTLVVTYLLENKKIDLFSLFQSPPDLNQVETELKQVEI